MPISLHEWPRPACSGSRAQLGLCLSAIPQNLSGRLEPVDVRQPVEQQDHREMAALRACHLLWQPGRPLRWSWKWGPSSNFRDLFQDSSIGRTDLPRPDGKTLKPRQGQCGTLGWPSMAQADSRGEMERTAVAGFALHPDRPAHVLHQPQEIVSPRPVPPYLRVVEPSACVNASKICCCFSAGIPIPVSRTEKCKTTSLVRLLLLFHFAPRLRLVR